MVVTLERGTGNAPGPALLLHPLAQATAAPLRLHNAQVDWPPSWSADRTPPTLTVDLRAHGSLQIDDVSAWQAALAAAGQRPSLAQRMQTGWPAFLAVALLALAGLGAFYVWGTPWAAAQITRQVPLGWETSLSERALADMDANLLKPSQLPAARQAQLRERFDQLVQKIQGSASGSSGTAGAAPVDAPAALQRYRGYAPRLVLAFRAGLGANAFALPGGTIVLTDGMVQAAANQALSDDALIGVLAHEIGHVLHRHTTRMVVEQGVLNVGLGLALGDVSGLLSIGTSLLTGLAYRRSHETEADCFAVALMRQAQLPTTPMADLLLGLERSRNPEQPGGVSVASLLASHPQTAERARKLKLGITDGC